MFVQASKRSFKPFVPAPTPPLVLLARLGSTRYRYLLAHVSLSFLPLTLLLTHEKNTRPFSLSQTNAKQYGSSRARKTEEEEGERRTSLLFFFSSCSLLLSTYRGRCSASYRSARACLSQKPKGRDVSFREMRFISRDLLERAGE